MQNFKLIFRFYSENYPEVNWEKYSIIIIARKVRGLKQSDNVSSPTLLLGSAASAILEKYYL